MYILIDYSNFVYLSFFAHLRVVGHKVEHIPENYEEHVYTFKAKIEKLLTKAAEMGCTVPVFAMDQKPVHKFELYPEYKAKRKQMNIFPKRAVNKMISNWGWKCLYSPNMEADDVIASFVARNCDTSQIMVVTTDKDLWQIADHPNTLIYNPHSGKAIDRRDLQEAFGITNYSQIALIKSLWGDPSDNVANAAPRMQKQLLPVIAETNGSLDDFYAKLKGVKLTARCKQLLKENKEQIDINNKLVTLNYNCPLYDWEWRGEREEPEESRA